MQTDQKKALTALLLLVPVPSAGVISAMILFPGTPLGKTLFVASKVWFFGLPIIWLKFADKGKFSLSPPRKGGFGAGALSGVLISLVIIGTYWLLGDRMIDRPLFAKTMADIGLASVPAYLACALYWILVNSVLEEYLWRWFVVEKCEKLFRPRIALLCSALFFTLHHAIAMRVFFNSAATALCATGIFIGGAVWSFLYMKYRSVWPGYLSHAIVDLCVFGIGASMVFANT